MTEEKDGAKPAQEKKKKAKPRFLQKKGRPPGCAGCKKF
jgi:hypothetical protein